MSQKKRIVITGIGLNTPLGDNTDDFYNNLMAGKSGIKLMKSLDTSMIRCKIGGDLGDYDIKAKLEKLKSQIPEDVFKRLRKISKTAPFSTKLTMMAAVDAYIDAGLFDANINKERMAAIIGGHNFHDNYIVKNATQFLEEPEYIDGLMGICVFDSDVVASIAETLKILGPMYIVGGTCTSAGISLKNAINEINYNDCDLALVGGGLLDYSALGYQALILVSAISYKSFNDDPEKSSRPYDTRREGFVPSHGTGIFIIEDLEHAKKRGAKIYAEILAVESNNDGNHLSNPSVDGQVRLIKRVLDKAGLKPEQIDYVNAHATSTPLGDKIEIQSIKEVFGAHAKNLKVNAPKSLLGHTGWTAHSVELIAAIMQMNNSALHPSINIDELDPECEGIDVCANKKVENYEINYILKNSFGFGGINCCSVIKKWSE
ncbi:MAG: beta-ketoacyl-[acyl-carrier-protein] synthase family protein [Spirochaetes bacterium]|nr:beta-ketoacyl-[acyl-carrier-protein] synthase family protein [Spirochaetota bacterium]